MECIINENIFVTDMDKVNSNFEIYELLKSEALLSPYFDNRVPAGFPSPAMDYVEQKLDLNDLLLRHPNSTFIIKVKGNSMTGEGINDEDLLIVDKSIQPAMNQIVLAEINGEYTVKRIEKKKGKLFLVAANKSFEPIAISEENEFMVWGVVTFCIHRTL